MNSTTTASNLTQGYQNPAIFNHPPTPTTLTGSEYSAIKLIMVIILSIMIILSNGLIVTVFATCRRLQKKPANFLITSQACSDLFTSLVFCPVHLLKQYHQHIRLEPYIIGYMIFLSLFNLLALCLDRYLALSKPFLHHRLTGVQRVIKQIAGVWTLPLFVTLLPLLWQFTSSRDSMNLAFLAIIWTVMLVLVISMTTVYTSVTMKAKRLIRNKRLSIISSKQNASSFLENENLTRKELRVVHLFGLLLFLFVATYLPIIYMNFCDMIQRVDLIPHSLEEISFFIILLGSVLNPIMSIYLKRDFHNSLKCRLLKRFSWKNKFQSNSDSLMGEMSFIIAQRTDSVISSNHFTVF